MIKQLRFKTLLLLCALIVGSLGAWGAKYNKVASPTSGKSYIVVAGGQYALKAASGGSGWLAASDVSTSISGTVLTTTATDIVWVMAKSGDDWTFKCGSNYMVNNPGTTYRNMGIAASVSTDVKNTFTLSGDKIYSTGSKDKYLQYLSTGPGFRMYSSDQTNSKSTFEYYEYTPDKSLTSISISGAPEKTTYFEGQTFDASGLVVTGTFSDESEEIVTASAEFTCTPSVLTTETSSVSVVATVSDVNSSAYAVSVTVNESPRVTIEPIENGNLTIMNGSDEVSSGDKVTPGTTLTIIVAPNSGYKFKNWQYNTGDSWITRFTNPQDYVMPSSDVAFRANFDEIVSHAITYNVNGVASSPVDIEEGEDIPLTAPTSGIPAGYDFIGWTTTPILTPQNDLPTIETSATSITDITYYAVFAKGSGSPASLTKMGGTEYFAAGDKIVIVVSGGNVAMKQETTNTSYVNKYDFDGKISTVSSDDKNWLTVTAGTDSKWKLGDETNGYIYNGSSNDLVASKDHATEFTLNYVDDKGFTFVGNSRWLSYRSDLSNKYFRMGGLSSSTGSGDIYFDIYKYVPENISYSGYCTTVPTTETATVTSAGWGTYVTKNAVEFRSGTKAFIVSVADDSEAVLDEVTSVPANTAILLKGEGTYTMDIVASSSTIVSGNCLKVADGTTNYNGKYVLANGKNGIGFYLWKGGKLNAGKVYMEPNSASSREFIGFFDDETTGITEMKDEKLNTKDVFNLNGMRVAQPQKGLYIVNGKKVVLK